MTDYTLNYSLPYPEGDDQVVVHADVERLAKRADQAVHSAKNEAINTASEDASTKANTAKTEAIDAAIQDATQKYGGVPQRVTTLETSVTTQGEHITSHSQQLTEQSETLDEHDTRLSGHDTTITQHDHKLEPVEPGDDQTFEIHDLVGRVAFGVTEHGHTRLGDTEVQANEPVFQITDQSGSIAFEIDTHGRTHIYDHGDDTGHQDVTTLHVFVAAGQSNMSGRGRPVEGPQSPRILQYGANRRILEQAPVILDMVDTPSGTSPALFFARNYLATQPPHVGVLLIPAARGATTFRGSPEDPSDRWTWTNGAALDPEHALYERSVEQTVAAVAAAETQGYHVIIKGVLWHQGEGNNGMATQRYGELLDALIGDYRTDLDHPTLPFLVGQQCPEGMEVTPLKYTVDAAHQDTPYRTPFTGFAPATWNGHNPGDTTHFSTVGTEHLGDTYATAYIQALGNTQRLEA